MGTNEKRRRSNTKEAIALLFIVVLIACVGYAFTNYVAQQKLVAAYFENNGQSTDTFYLEIAESESKRQLGLMYRKSMPSNQGMIFVFPVEKKVSFWMKDTYLSLDMIFVNKDQKVVGILPNVPILNQLPRTIDADSQYVIELNAGAAEKAGIKVGSTLKLNKSLPRAS